MFKVNNRSTSHRFDVFIVNFEYIWHVVLFFFFFFCDFEHVNARWNTLLLLSRFIRFRVRLGALSHLEKALYNNSQRQFPVITIFWDKELHLRCCIGLGINVVTQPAKILESMEGSAPHDRVQCWRNMKNLLSSMP